MNNTNKQLPATTKASPQPSPARLWPLWLIILVLALGLLGSGLMLWEQHRNLLQQHRSQQQLSERLDTLDNATSELRQNRQSRLNAREQRLNRLEAKLDEQASTLNTQSRQIAHNARSLLGLGQRTQTDWLLAEAEYLLRVANQRLELEGDHQGALRLLQNTDDLLAGTDAAGVHPIREALAEEILALRTMEPVDRTGIHLQLEAAMGMIPDLGSAQSMDGNAPLPGTNNTASQESDAGAWHKVLGILDRMVRIRRVNEPSQALLTPAQETQAQLHLQLMFEQAAAALLRGDDAIYRRSLGRADDWLERWYNTSNQTATALRDLISELRDEPINAVTPDISDSLALLKARIRSRAETSGPQQSDENSDTPEQPQTDAGGNGETGE
ncbi:uroporphyrinogen-III C-methyltransferase [Salicola sp. Rm-C-2C1-2]|uniref:uroporphyrinogen-III C-methyltransferase n=1 Tax=Salicola sp. Rm-C-2C1-2 TaxID=3141321 RepID=UPI0032E41565